MYSDTHEWHYKFWMEKDFKFKEKQEKNKYIKTNMLMNDFWPLTHLLVRPGNGPGSWRFVRGLTIPVGLRQDLHGVCCCPSYPPTQWKKTADLK